MKKDGFFIDTKTFTITAIEWENLSELRRLVGGHLEVAFMWHVTGDVLYVDEEGLLKHGQSFFSIPERSDQVLAGNAVLVGREVEGSQYPEGFTTLKPSLTIDALADKVTFLGRARGR